MDETVKKPHTAREMLDLIDEFMVEHYTPLHGSETRNLWDVLTGLRGPDRNDEAQAQGHYPQLQAKLATTAVIRQHAFPEFARRHGGVLALVNSDESNHAITREQMHKGGGFRYDRHFLVHMSDAFRALGLTWDVRNDDPDVNKKKDTPES